MTLLSKRPRPVDHWGLCLSRDPARDLVVLARYARTVGRWMVVRG